MVESRLKCHRTRQSPRFALSFPLRIKRFRLYVVSIIRSRPYVSRPRFHGSKYVLDVMITWRHSIIIIIQKVEAAVSLALFPLLFAAPARHRLIRDRDHFFFSFELHSSPSSTGLGLHFFREGLTLTFVCPKEGQWETHLFAQSWLAARIVSVVFI